MNGWEIAVGAALSVFLAEFTEICPWLARKLVCWAACRWADSQAKAEQYAEEWAAVVEERPGKLLKLMTAAQFTFGATWRGIVGRLKYTRHPGLAAGRLTVPPLQRLRWALTRTIMVPRLVIYAILPIGLLGGFFLGRFMLSHFDHDLVIRAAAISFGILTMVAWRSAILGRHTRLGSVKIVGDDGSDLEP